MLSVGMHCRLLGRPGRFATLRRFMDYIASHERVWVCRRVDIARHWCECIRMRQPRKPAWRCLRRVPTWRLVKTELLNKGTRHGHPVSAAVRWPAAVDLPTGRVRR